MAHHATSLLCLILISTAKGLRVINYNSNYNLDTDSSISQRIASDNCPNEDAVNLNNQHIEEVEPCFINSTFIKNVNLAKNQLKAMPKVLLDCVPNLECLNVAFNNIAKDDLFDFEHQNLKTLILDSQGEYLDWYRYPMESPIRKKNFPNLEILHLNELGIVMYELDYIEMFPQLSTLYLTDNNITSIGYEFFSKLPLSVQHLHLERNQLKNLYGAENLLSLYLDDNPFNGYIPIKISNVHILSLRHCNLNSMSVNTFFKNGHESLKLLDLSDNRIDDIPTNLLINGGELDVLILTNNRIRKIPDIKSLSSLTKLSLSKNRIDHVRDMVSSSLEILNLRDNEINEIDVTTFSELPALIELDLSENLLESLPFNWADGLRNLLSLNLNSNKFLKFTDISVTSVINLRHLYIKQNPFFEINEVELRTVPEYCNIYVV